MKLKKTDAYFGAYDSLGSRGWRSADVYRYIATYPGRLSFFKYSQGIIFSSRHVIAAFA